jgi:FecR-like protein
VSGDYLWDRSGPRDPDVVELERLLAPLGQAHPAPAFRAPSVLSRRRASPAFVIAVTVAAAAVVALVAVVYESRTAPVIDFGGSSGFNVTTIAGAPTIASRPIGDRARLPLGRWIETDAAARAAIDIADIGRVELDPDSRLGLLSARPGDYRLHLVRGTLRARIWAPPGQFSVETPSSTTVDLGCAYTLTVGDDGAGLVRVTSGWVGFEWRGRESFIPAGAVCVTRPAMGPGTPYFDDVSDAFRSAIDVIDAGHPLAPNGVAERRAAIDRVLREARDKDVVTLWHLLSRVHPDERDRVFDALAQRVPPPASVTRQGIRAGDSAMLDAWWDRLGLGTTDWWRTWKQQWRDRSPR